MKNNFDKIDELFKKGLENHKVQPSPKVWLGLKKTLVLKKILGLQFVAGSKALTTLTLAGSIVLITSAVYFTAKPLKNNEVKAEKQQKEQIEKTITETGKPTEPDIKQKDYSELEKVTQTDPETQIASTEFEQAETLPAPENKQKVVALTTEANNTQTKPEQKANKSIFLPPLVHDTSITHMTPVTFDLLDSQLLNSPTRIFPDITSTETNSPKTKFPLEIRYWEGFAFTKNILSSQNTEANHYLEKRKKSETPGIFYSRGVEASYYLNNWIFQSGINYHTLGENYDFNIKIQTYDSVGYKLDSFISVRWEYIYDSTFHKLDSFPVGRLEYIKSIIYDTSSVHKYYNGVNRYRYIELPVLLGRRFQLNKLKLNLTTGVSFGFLFSSEGSFHDFYDKKVISNQELVPLNKTLMTFLFRMGCHYPLNDRLDVLAEPRFRYTINSVLDKSYPIDQKYFSYGLNLGMVLKF